jgi:glutaminyl-tRNA synthetase
LVEEKIVSGWDDPRMPTIAGLRRRGYTPEAIRNFAELVGVAKKDSTSELSLLEFCIREDLNKRAQRAMAVLQPLKVVIDNYPDDMVEELEAINNPEDENMGKRQVPFSKVIYIEKNDFMEEPPKNYFRLSPGAEVRLRYGYYITCKEAVKDENTGEIIELHCAYDPETRGGWSPDGRKVKGTIHWVSASHALDAEVRLYNNLFTRENPMDTSDGSDFLTSINPDSLEIVHAKVEPFLKDSGKDLRYQFERQGYFCNDFKDSTEKHLVFNRIVTLRDTWAKMQKKEK